MNDQDRGEHVKTVYAHFGLAMYLSQVLEHGLVNALFVLDLVPNAAKAATPKTWPDIVDSYFDEQFQKTLGRLISKLKQHVAVAPEFEDVLSSALSRRNWLAHHYFRERAEQAMSSDGRDGMIAELEAAQEFFQQADAMLESVVNPVFERYGYTEERIALLLDKMKREAASDL